MAVGTDVAATATVAAIHNVVAIAVAVAFVVVHRRMQWEPTTIESSSSDVRGLMVSPRETAFQSFCPSWVVSSTTVREIIEWNGDDGGSRCVLIACCLLELLMLVGTESLLCWR